MNRIAVLMTCHNRRETTLRCLGSLREQWERKVGVGVGQWRLDVYLVDDGSTDGTSAAVKKWEKRWEKEVGVGQWKIHLIKGSGHDYWAKGMCRAWQEAVGASTPTRNSHYDAFLWLNDDVVLRSDAIEKLLSAVPLPLTTPTVVVGELVNAKGEKTYGLNGHLFNGNCVLVLRKAYEKVGMICGEYAHAWADSDYAMRCHRNGVKAVSAGVVGTCEGHPLRPSLRGVGFRHRWRMLFDPKGWNLHDLWLYRKRNWGVCVALWSCAHMIVHVLLAIQCSTPTPHSH